MLEVQAEAARVLQEHILERKLRQLSVERRTPQQDSACPPAAPPPAASSLAALPTDMLHAILAQLGTRSLATAAVVWPAAAAAVARARVRASRPSMVPTVVPPLRSCASLEALEAAVGPRPAGHSWREEYVPLRLRLAIASPLKHPAAVAGVEAWARGVPGWGSNPRARSARRACALRPPTRR